MAKSGERGRFNKGNYQSRRIPCREVAHTRKTLPLEFVQRVRRLGCKVLLHLGGMGVDIGCKLFTLLRQRGKSFVGKPAKVYHPLVYEPPQLRRLLIGKRRQIGAAPFQLFSTPRRLDRRCRKQ